MSVQEALLMPVGEMKDLISLHAVDMGVAKIKENQTMTFDEIMALR